MNEQKTEENPLETATPEDKAVISEAKEKGDILNVSNAEQFKTVKELFERSQPNSVYYSLLIVSIFIVASGLLLGNAPIVIGGMLVTPVLTPILLIALGLTVGELKAMKTPAILIAKSLIIAILISAALAIAFGVDEMQAMLPNTIRTAMLYLVVATASGIAATFAWTRKQVAEILPGISIAVSLVPPLSLIGIHLGILDFETARFYVLIFALNFAGIVVGSSMVFSLLKFQKWEYKVKEKGEETDKIQEYKKAEKKAVKAEKKMEEVKKNVEELNDN